MKVQSVVEALSGALRTRGVKLVDQMGRVVRAFEDEALDLADPWAVVQPSREEGVYYPLFEKCVAPEFEAFAETRRAVLTHREGCTSLYAFYVRRAIGS